MQIPRKYAFLIISAFAMSNVFLTIGFEGHFSTQEALAFSIVTGILTGMVAIIVYNPNAIAEEENEQIA